MLSVLVMVMAGCYSTAGVGYPAEFIDAHRPARIWVTETSDSMLILDSPQMEGDTLRGYAQGVYREIKMSDVKFVRARVLSPAKTAVLVGAGMLTAAGLVATLTTSKQSANICFNGADQQVPCP
jgi:hypothetical protein